jgi:hypothetical protein
MNARRNARHARRIAARTLRHGATLRVVGSEKAGFKLAVAVGDTLVSIGHGFSKQKDAVGHGEIAFGLKATKVVARKAKVAAEAA